jgi:hypothetical protein
MAIKKKTQKKKEKQQAVNNTRPIWQTWETTCALYQRNVSNLKPKAEPKKKKTASCIQWFSRPGHDRVKIIFLKKRHLSTYA